MQWRATKKGKHISREAMLASKPVRNELVEWERDDNNEVVIRLTRQDNWKVKVLAKLFYIPKQRKIGLDTVGSQVWEMCDGKHSVDRMIRILAKEHKLNRKEAEVALMAYLLLSGLLQKRSYCKMGQMLSFASRFATVFSAAGSRKTREMIASNPHEFRCNCPTINAFLLTNL